MFSAANFLILLVALLGLCVLLIYAWTRKFVLPGIKQKPEPLPVTQEWPGPIQKPPFGAIPRRLEIGLGLGAIALYLVVRLIGLDQFPIYFFADEAAQTVLAEELIQNNFKIEEELFPTYFYNVDKYSLSVSVYLQVLPYLIWGKSIWVTRGVSVLVTLVGVLAVGLTLKQIFQTQYWWLGILILSVTPAWFLHSRTAFETVIATAFYAGFLYAYLLYLYRSPKYLYAAILVGGLTFYTYNPARMVILITWGLLLFSDFRYHWQNRKVFVWGLLFVGLLTIPYLRFQYYHPFEEWDHLMLLHSYWTQDILFYQKLLTFGREYLRGLNIAYWYLPKVQDIPRHVMKGYGHFLWILFPFLLVGLWLAIRNWRISAYRVLLIALVCSPVGGAMFRNSVTRAFMIIIPVTLLTSIGMIKIMSVPRILQERQKWIAALLFAIFCGGNVLMLSDALKNGAYWFDDYTLYGMQYGGQQVFSAVNDYLQDNPDSEVVVSYKWLNGPNMVIRFFIENTEMVFWGILSDIEKQNIPLDDDIIFVLTADEWENLPKHYSSKYEVFQTIPFPDNSAGFYFVKRK